VTVSNWEGGGEGADVDAVVVGGADREPLGPGGEGCGELVAQGLGHVQALDGDAELARGGEACGDDAVGGAVDVGVVEDDHGVLAAEFEGSADEALSRVIRRRIGVQHIPGPEASRKGLVMPNSSLTKPPRILFIGGGYAGLYSARKLLKKLRRQEATVTVVDPRSYMTYLPFLPEAAGGRRQAAGGRRQAATRSELRTASHPHHERRDSTRTVPHRTPPSGPHTGH
jgi:hypothetical protein